MTPTQALAEAAVLALQARDESPEPWPVDAFAALEPLRHALTLALAAAPPPLTVERLARALHAEAMAYGMECRHGNQHHRSWECFEHADRLDALAGDVVR